MAEELKLNDPVRVTREKGNALEGVIAHMGKVQFSDETDWVGVRLTGPSVGLGKNNGTVQGVTYFECPANNGGLFCRLSALEKRTLSKLEEMRLKRELSTAKKTSSITPTKAASATSTSSSQGDTTDASTTAKKEALAARRAALLARRQESRTAGSAAASTTSSTVATPSKVGAASKTPIRSSTATPKALTPPAASKLGVPTETVAKLENELVQLKEDLAKSREEAKSLETKLEKAQEQRKRDARTIEELKEHQQQDPSESNVEEVLQLKHERDDLSQKVAEVQKQAQVLEQVHSKVLLERDEAQNEVAAMKTQVEGLEGTLQDQKESASSTTAHYKERAKLQADLANARRQVSVLQEEKIGLDHIIEDLTLDKEQLVEERDELRDRMEELKLDAETAQMEAEEAKLQFEDAQQMRAKVDASTPGTGESGDKDEELHTLGIQNGRLREALIRLREQSTLEQMESQKALRAAQKEANQTQELREKVEKLQAEKSRQDEALNDLKDMVEQGSAWEGMVEDMSDRVLGLEEDNAGLRRTIRELEEGMDLTAEMEEVQTEEIKSLNQDLQGRDTIIRNLEQAVKMQRRRLEDLQQTVTNYRSSVETLRQEKQALLDLQQGGEGERSNLVQSTQQALARAAQLVADAADMRKKQARAVADAVDLQVYRHLSERMEAVLPSSTVAAEISSIKGELLTSKVIGKAAKTLAGLNESFALAIQPTIEPREEGPSILNLGEEVKQRALIMLHETEFAGVIAEGSSELLRFLAAGQWPDTLSPKASVELGSVLGSTVQELDILLGDTLKSLKEEGYLLPEQSDVGPLKQGTEVCLQNVRAALERDGGLLVPDDWKPSAWQLVRDVSVSKLMCDGTTACISVIVNQANPSGVPTSLFTFYKKLEQLSVQGRDASLRLANLEVSNEIVVKELTTHSSEWKKATDELGQLIRTMIHAEGQLDMTDCMKSAEQSLVHLTKLLSSLRAANLNPSDDDRKHALSPESEDAWLNVARLARSVRAINGDPDDINHIVRARNLEAMLEDAVANEPKLASANSKVSNLEKSLSTRSKEIAMLNARLSELESVLAKTNASPVKRSANTKPSESQTVLKEENRVVSIFLTKFLNTLQIS